MLITEVDGKIVVEDEPVVLAGNEAVEFLAKAHEREENGMSEEQQRFQQECREAYERAWAQRSAK